MQFVSGSGPACGKLCPVPGYGSRRFLLSSGSEVLEPTAEECAAIDAAFDEWRDIRCRTYPADRRRAERAIGETYERISKRRPRFVWCDSPLACARHARKQLLLGETSLLRELQKDLSVTRARSRWIHAAMHWWVESQKGPRMSPALMNLIGMLDFFEFWNVHLGNIAPLICNAIEPRMGKLRQQAFGGQHDAYFAAGFSLLRRLFGDELVAATVGDVWPAARAVLSILKELSSSCGWWFPFEDVCFVSERTRAVHHDEHLRLHSADRFALEYPDGWGVCVWHGVSVPTDWIFSRDQVDPSNVIDWEDLHQRRALAEILGWERVLYELSVKLLDGDPTSDGSVLFAGRLPRGPAIRFLQNEQGHLLRVPLDLDTVQDAKTWTSSAEVPGIRMPGESSYRLLLDPEEAKAELRARVPSAEVRMFERRGCRELTDSGWRWAGPRAVSVHVSAK